jgi:hypothetical protein
MIVDEGHDPGELGDEHHHDSTDDVDDVKGDTYENGHDKLNPDGDVDDDDDDDIGGDGGDDADSSFLSSPSDVCGDAERHQVLFDPARHGPHGLRHRILP